ncbi:hypothetical protein Back11_59180 [Paenibacillus baekrokdamisoli]|uniref:Uncharacterized protein n=1 Tax=Paenibacillus baekrokdamisoli TaxID=1712516 RepID=A0A3G9JHY0_9BACL|nr:hypothetical protein Back11_59180 [Paenibacillus baekrokdamisoli]
MVRSSLSIISCDGLDSVMVFIVPLNRLFSLYYIVIITKLTEQETTAAQLLSLTPS